MWSLAPCAVGDLEKAVRWARTAASDQPCNPDLQGLLGAVLYRTGRFEEAARRLKEAVAIRGHTAKPLDHLFLAMAHSRSGRHVTARTWLTRAVAALDRSNVPRSPGSSGPLPLHWNNESELAVLRLEAEALILAPELPADPFSRFRSEL
jgi:tetratricopeptide (TPR) repeat protein